MSSSRPKSAEGTPSKPANRREREKAAAIPGAKAQMLPKPVVGPYWRHEQILDITRIREDLGYEPQYDVAKGVADFARELREHNHPT